MDKTITIIVQTENFEQETMMTEEMVKQAKYPEMLLLTSIENIWEKEYGEKVSLSNNQQS